jgi:DNA polymerase
LKREGKKKEREPYKRICNITYGAEGDMFNPMYDPLHRNLVCVFGQVLIIDLLEKIEDLIELLQSNTDGIFVKLEKRNVPELKRRITEWENRTGLKMSYEAFTAIYQKDVNNYIAVPEGDLYDEKGKPRWHSKGAYVKELGDLDYDLPIVNEAVKQYLLCGTSVEITVNRCQDFRMFQKIVKLSNKYKWVEHESKGKKVRYDNKCYRVFASNNPKDGRILKCDGVRNPAKFGNTPDNCFIVNDDIGQAKTSRFPQLNKQWYIDLAKKRLEDFGVW